MILQQIVKFHPCRNDIAGALEIILENAPYGPNVDEAKVCTHTHPPPLFRLKPFRPRYSSWI